MAPTIELPRPVYSPLPFFSPLPESSQSFFDASTPAGTAPQSPVCGMERSIRQVMSKYGAGDLHGSALLPSYRCLRRRRPQEENQAVAVTHDENTYKIMVDVRDFAEGSITVRAVGDNELVVEGIIERKEESSPSEQCKTSKSCSKTFQQRFMFPGLQVEGVASTVSSDGVLTVTAPRKVTDDKSVEFSMPVTQGNLTENSTQARQVTTTSSVQATQQQTSQMSSETSVPQNKVVVERVGEHIVPIEVEGQLVINASGNTANNFNTQTMQENQIKSSQQSTVSAQTTSTEKKEQVESAGTYNKTQNETGSSNTRNVPISTEQQQSSKSIFDDMLKDSLVPIDNRGSFFQDSFFENSRRYFQDAVNSVMKRVSKDTPASDPINWYQNHRTSNLLEDTRAGTIKTEEKDYKIVLDVKDFEEGSVNVRAIGDSEILIEGKVEKKTGGTSFSRRFRRRFVMPGMVKCESITSALSSDGVLTVTAPKKESHFKIVELTGANQNITNKYLANSSIFGSNTPSCASPSISMPPSSVTSPTADIMTGPFQPVLSKTVEESVSKSNESYVPSSTFTQQQQQQERQQEYAVNTQATTTQQSNIQSEISETLRQASKLVDSQREHLIPIEQEGVKSTLSSNEKMININYIDKSQKEIDAIAQINNLNKETKQSSSSNPQYQLIGTVKDLSDVNLKETAKQRKTSNSQSQSQGTREITIKYDDPSRLVFPIVRRGPFYQDSFFNEVQQNFQSAIRQVLDRWVDVPSLLFSNRNNTSSLCNFDRFNSTLSNYRSILDCDLFDDLTCYKNLRHRSLCEENQATSVKENAEDYKIVLDVHGFSEKDLKITATSHNELVVEGCVESKSPGSQSCHKFRRQFILAGPVRMEAVHSALSADDILTITVPKNKLLRITDSTNIRI